MQLFQGYLFGWSIAFSGVVDFSFAAEEPSSCLEILHFDDTSYLAWWNAQPGNEKVSVGDRIIRIGTSWLDSEAFHLPLAVDVDLVLLVCHCCTWPMEPVPAVEESLEAVVDVS